MAVLTEDQIESIDQKTGKIRYKSGAVGQLDDEALFSLTGSKASQKIADEEEALAKRSKEGFSQLPFGSEINTFLDQALNSSLLKIVPEVQNITSGTLRAFSPMEGQEDKNFIERAYENYIGTTIGKRRARQQGAQENPRSAMLGTLGGLATDLALPTPKNPALTGALFGATASEKGLLESPQDVLTGGLTGGALGYGLGKIGGKLEKISEERRALRNFPKLQKEAKRAYQQRIANFRSNAGNKIQAMEKDLGKFGIPKSAMNVEDFIAKEVGVSSLAGSKEAQEIEKFLVQIEKSLPDTMKAQDVAKVFESVEMKMDQLPQLSQNILQKFQNHLVEQLPIGASQNKLMGKIFPRVEKETMQVVNKYFDSLPKNVVNEIEKEIGKGSLGSLKRSVQSEIRDRFSSLSPQEFVDVLQNRDVSSIIEPILKSETYQIVANLPDVLANKAWINGSSNLPKSATQAAKRSLPTSVFEAQTRFQNLPSQISNRIERVLSKHSIDASIVANETQKQISSRLSNAIGVQNPFTGRQPTNARVGPYVEPQAPSAGYLANRFESKPLNVAERSTGAALIGGLGKLAGIPKVGAIAGGAKALTLGLEGTLRGLTSPTALGNIARQGLQRGGPRFIVSQIAQNYPSYEGGILKDPQDRQQAVSDIELNPDIPLEDKAILQAYINRGKNLETFLENY